MDLFAAQEVLARSSANDANRKKKIEALQVIELTIDTFVDEEDFNEILSFTLAVLIKTLHDGDMNVWSLTEQVLVKVLKFFHTTHFDIIIAEIWKALKGDTIQIVDNFKNRLLMKYEGRSRRFALDAFAYFAVSFKPKNDAFKSDLILSLVDISKGDDQLLHEALSKNIGIIAKFHLYNATAEDLKPLILSLSLNSTSSQHKTRRSSVLSLTTLCENIKNNTGIIKSILDSIICRITQSPLHEIGPNTLDSIPNDHKDEIIQGVTHALTQFLRLESSAKVIRDYVPTIIHICLAAMKLKDNQNILVGGLELFEAILSSYNVFEVQGIDKGYPIESILETLGDIVFMDNPLFLSSQVQAMRCLASLCQYMQQELQLFTKKNFDRINALLQYNDPLLRGQGFIYLASFIKYWIQCDQKIVWEHFNIIELLSYIMETTFKDDSSFVAKACCKGLMLLVNTLLTSEYYEFVPYMINYLLQFPETTHKIVKSKIASLFATINYRIVNYIESLETKTSHYDKLPHIPRLKKTLLQDKIIDAMIVLLSDHDSKVRTKASRALVHLIPNIHAPKYGDDLEYHAVQCIQDLQTSIHKSSLLNNSWREQIDIIMFRIYPLMNQNISEYHTKGFITFLRYLLECGYEVSPGFAPIILEQVQTHSSISDLETQLDVLVVLGHSTCCMNANYLKFIRQIFTHSKLVFRILRRILKRKQSVAGTKLPVQLLQGDFMEHAYYRMMFDKLEDVYGLSLSTFDKSIFDDFCIHSLRSMERAIPFIGRLSNNSIEDLYDSSEDFFFLYTEETIDFLDELLYLVHDGVYPSTSTLYGLNQHELTFLKEPTIGKAIPPLSLFSSKWIDRCRYDKTFQLVYGKKTQLFLQTERTWRRPYSPPVPSKNAQGLMQRFNRIANYCLDMYSTTQCTALKGKLLNFISKLGAYGANCVSSDMNSYFIKHIHDRLSRSLEHVLSERSYIYDSFKSELFSQDILIPIISLSFEMYIRRKLSPPGSLKLKYNDYMNMIDGLFNAEWYKEDNVDPMKTIIFVLFHPIEDDNDHYQGLEVEMNKLSIDEDLSKEDSLDTITFLSMKEKFVINMSMRISHQRAIEYLKMIVENVENYISDKTKNRYYGHILKGYQNNMELSNQDIQTIHDHFFIIDRIPTSMITGEDFAKYLTQRVEHDASQHSLMQHDSVQHVEEDSKWISMMILTLRLLIKDTEMKNVDIPRICEILITSLERISRIVQVEVKNDDMIRKSCLFITSLISFTQSHPLVVETLKKMILEKEGSFKSLLLSYLKSKYSSLLFNIIPWLIHMKLAWILIDVIKEMKKHERKWHWKVLEATIILSIIKDESHECIESNDPWIHHEMVMALLVENASMAEVSTFLRSMKGQTREKMIQYITMNILSKKMGIHTDQELNNEIKEDQALEGSQSTLSFVDDNCLLSLIESLGPSLPLLKCLMLYFLSHHRLSLVLHTERIILEWIKQTNQQDACVGNTSVETFIGNTSVETFVGDSSGMKPDVTIPMQDTIQSSISSLNTATSLGPFIIQQLENSGIRLRRSFIAKIESIIGRDFDVSNECAKELSLKVIEWIQDPFIHLSSTVDHLITLLNDSVKRAMFWIGHHQECEDWKVIIEEFASQKPLDLLTPSNTTEVLMEINQDSHSKPQHPTFVDIHSEWVFVRNTIRSIYFALSKQIYSFLEPKESLLLAPSIRMILCLANYSIKLLILANNVLGSIAEADIVDVLLLTQYLFKTERTRLLDDAQSDFLIKSLFHLSTLLFGPNKKHMLKRLTNDLSIDEIFTYFYDIYVNRPNANYTYVQGVFCEVLSLLIHASSERELVFFPFKATLINYDYADNPVDILKHHLYVINSSTPLYPETFVSLWNQLYRGIDPSEEIHPDATSQPIKVLTIRALTSLILKTAYRTLRKDDYRFLGMPLLKIDDLRKNVTYTMANLNVSNLLRDFLAILRDHIAKYCSYNTKEPSVGKESLRCVILLSDLFDTNMRMMVHDILIRYFESSQQYLEDPLITNYLLLGTHKSMSISWNVIQTSKDRARFVFKRIHEILYEHFSTLHSLRQSPFSEEEVTTFPTSKAIFLMTLNYLLQAKVISLSSSMNEMIYLWIKVFVKPKLASLSFETFQDAKVLESAKNGSPLMKSLALDCYQEVGKSRK